MEQSTCQHNWYPHDDYYTCLNCGLDAADAEASGDLARRREQDRRAACYPALVAALKEVEWVDLGDGGFYCPWCGTNERYGHATDCQRAAALALARGEGAEQ